MQVRLVDLADDRTVARLHQVWVASRAVDRPWNDPQSLPPFALELRFQDSGEHHEVWGAYDADLLVGFVQLWIPLQDNTTKVFASIDVDPPHRCRGAGSALLDQVVQVARTWSRDEIVGDLLAPVGSTSDHPYRRFPTKHGFTEASMESIRHLSLPVPGHHLDELTESARPYWAERYDVATFVNGVPDELQQSLCDASNLLDVDAPSGDIDFEPESLTPERYRDELGLEREQGTTRLTTVALDRSDGRVVAFTDLIVLGGTRRAVWQWGTLVQAEHRGHRLGLAVKVANLRALQEAFPEREYVVTGNADLNAWMVSINERLGFRVREIGPMYLRRL